MSCLRENKHRHVTVEMIADYLMDKGDSVGQTTIYRNLDNMVKNGAVLKFIAPEGMYACYQYLEQNDDHPDGCHLVCTDCGRMTRLDCNYLNQFTVHILEEHGFNLDSARTILYGKCQRCNE